MEAIDAALHEVRIDTHAHIVDSPPSLREESRRWRRFSNAKDIISSRIAAEGCRRLYGIDTGSFFRPDSSDAAFEESERLREHGTYEACLKAFKTSGIREQLIFADCIPERMRPLAQGHTEGRIFYLAFIDDVISGDGHRPSPEHEGPFNHYQALCAIFGNLSTLDDYIGNIESEIARWRDWGVVGMKTATAYTYGLTISDPSASEARQAFRKKTEMSMEDRRTVHDFAFRRALDTCLEYGFPVLFHTGYQIWGGSDLSQSNPRLLHDIIADRRYRDLRFVLLHGGNPYVGETTYLAGQFPNVYVDFTWLPWMSPARFAFALAEWLHVIPNDKFCWGTDAGTPEGIAGADSMTRRAIAEAIDLQIRSGAIDEHYALEFVRNTYIETPKALFGL